MKNRYNIERGIYSKISRAWLVTWEWAGEHAKVKDKFVAIISSRRSESTVKQILEQYFVTGWLSLHEQFSYAKSKSSCPYKVQSDTVEVSKRIQKATHWPSRLPFNESLRIGDNPWLWGRIVHELETWIDEKGFEHLKWKERENLLIDGGPIKSDWIECSLKRRQ